MQMKKPLSFLLVAIVSFGLMTGCAVKVEKALQKAEEYETAENWEKAVKQYEKALKAEPENTEIRRDYYMAKIMADVENEENWVTFLEFCEKEGMHSFVLDILYDTRGRVPGSDRVKSLLSDYRPPAPYLNYYREGYIPPIGSFYADKPVTSAVETAFFLSYTYAEDYIPWADEIRYTINGEEHAEPYRHNNNNRIFTINPTRHFTTPGHYKIEMSSYASEYDLSSSTQTVEFTIPEECVGTVSASTPGGTYDTLGSIQLSTTADGVTVYYTTDGSDPVLWDDRGKAEIKGKKYTGVIPLDVGETTISARAVNAGGIISALCRETYAVQSAHAAVAHYAMSWQTDGHFMYNASQEGVFRYNMDGTGKTCIFEGQVSDMAVMTGGKVAFYATPEKKYNKNNRYYVYYYDNGKIDRSQGSPSTAKLEAIGNRLYINEYYNPWTGESDQPMTDAQKKALLCTDQYNIYISGTPRGLEVSAPDGSNWRVLQKFPEKPKRSGHFTIHALNGTKLLYSTYYSSYPSDEPGELHYYVMDITTGEYHATPELDAVRSTFCATDSGAYYLKDGVLQKTPIRW